ncbi:hypothetical protein D3C85_1702660 [compost metagenome]
MPITQVIPAGRTLAELSIEAKAAARWTLAAGHAVGAIGAIGAVGEPIGAAAVEFGED